MKSGNYLSSRQLSASTFGVKELNFCVRYGNRWILFAIITAMVIYQPLGYYILVFALLPCIGLSALFFFWEDLQLHSKAYYLATFFFLWVRKNFSFVRLKRLLFSLSRSSPRPISIGQLLHYCIYTSDLSTWLSSRGLTSLCCGIPYLEASFTLRCFQRLSQPHSATLLCRWRDNRCTVGAFIPVLSY